MSTCYLNTLKLLFLYGYELITLFNKLCLNVYMSLTHSYTIVPIWL